jgi:adenosylcobinamide-GDP ribazoletransferase
MLRPLLCATGFLTRAWLPPIDYSDEEVARSAGFFTWVGALLAGLLWVAARVLAPFGERITALALVALWAFATAGLHLDGLADAVDGASGGRGQRERTLEIMRDGRVGPHGALALLLLVLCKWAALERLLVQGDAAWLCAPVVARFLCTLLVARFPYAREAGLGSSFAGRVGARELLLGALPLLGCALLDGFELLLSALFGVCAALLWALRFQRLLGGLTGDVYGACIELCEACVLLGLCLR